MHPWNEPLFESLRRRTERLPHGLLIHGARGIGKLALAEHVARFLLCEAADAGLKPCGACEGCRWFAAGSHPDFRRVQPEALAREPVGDAEEGDAPAKKGKPSTEIKIEQVRELAGFLNMGSHRARLRVALVHPAESMTPNAANALLKGLEEPPAGAVFLLVSDRPARLLPTVRSRCVSLPAPIPPRAQALDWLAQEGVQHPGRWLAYAGGAPLLALHHAGRAALLERLLQRPAPVEDRGELETLAEALQKLALDRALMAFGLPPKYQTGGPAPDRSQAQAWLAFARQMGQHRLLASHPLNPKLFSHEMLAAMPR